VIVVDASALTEVLLRGSDASTIERLLASAGAIHGPHLLDLEVTQVLRRYAARGLADPARCRQALDDLEKMGLRRHPHDHLLSRVWDLRHNLTAYDAVYVALAEYLGAPLLTRDRRLAAAPGHFARIDLV
jgi:predicted nucleic acid-binding protein